MHEGNWATLASRRYLWAWHVADDVTRTMRIDSGALVAATGSVGSFGSNTFFEGGEPAVVAKLADRGRPVQRTPIAGAPMIAVRRSFPAEVRGGLLTLAFRPINGDAIVSAVEVAR